MSVEKPILPESRRAERFSWAHVPLFLASVLIVACPGGIPGFAVTPDAGTMASDKALLYNLIGRWYTDTEIKRLSDRTLSAEQWCEREPQAIFVIPDRVEVRCENEMHSAMIATVKSDEDHSVTILLRSKEDSPLKSLHFQVQGPKATISGSPCFNEASVAYGRFPEYEILSREILGGRRCPEVLLPTKQLDFDP